jgi:hypothetical protein
MSHPDAELEHLNDSFAVRTQQILRLSSIAQAIRYGLNHWDGLVRFLDDGRIEIDSSSAACNRLL